VPKPWALGDVSLRPNSLDDHLIRPNRPKTPKSSKILENAKKLRIF